MAIVHNRAFHLNSADRISGVNSSNFTTRINIPAHEKFTHVLMNKAAIPKSYYMVRDGYNTFTLQEDGVNIACTITPGNYNLTFQSAISDLLTTNSLHGFEYEVTYDLPSQVQTGKLTYTVSNNFIYPGVPSQPSFIFTTNVFEMFGFPRNSTATFVDDVLRSTNVVKFQSKNTIFIHSDLVADGAEDILQEIYTSGVADFANIVNEPREYQTSSKPITTSTSNVFRFSVTDEDGRLLDLNGLEWVCTICVYCVAEEHARHPKTIGMPDDEQPSRK